MRSRSDGGSIWSASWSDGRDPAVPSGPVTPTTRDWRVRATADPGADTDEERLPAAEGGLLLPIRELVAKRMAHGVSHIHNQVDDPQQAQRLDTQLWTFRKESFIPHALQQKAEGEPVVIGDQPEALSDDARLINLRAEVLAPWKAFGRLFDVAVQEPDILRQTRSHFRLC